MAGPGFGPVLHRRSWPSLAAATVAAAAGALAPRAHRPGLWLRSFSTRVCSLLSGALLFLPRGLAEAERQKIIGMQYNPTNQRETPWLSFSTLCLYLVFPFSEELGSQHLLPQHQSVGGVLWERNLHSIMPMATIISRAYVPVLEPRLHSV